MHDQERERDLDVHDLDHQLGEIKQALARVLDLGVAEDLLDQRDAVTRRRERRLEGVRIVEDNRARAAGLDGRTARLAGLRAAFHALTVRREALERELREKVADAEREASTNELRGLAWTLPHVRKLIGERDQVVSEILNVETQLGQLEVKDVVVKAGGGGGQ